MRITSRAYAYLRAVVVSKIKDHRTKTLYALISIGIVTALFPLAVVAYAILTGALMGDEFLWLLLAGLIITAAMMSLGKKLMVLFNTEVSLDIHPRSHPHCTTRPAVIPPLVMGGSITTWPSAWTERAIAVADYSE